MKRSTIAILVLIALLVGSNGFWIWQQIESGVGAFYGERLLVGTRHQSARLFSALAQEKDKEDVISIFEKELGMQPTYESEDILSFGYLRLEFDRSGRLIKVTSI